MELRTCTKCLINKDISCFHKRKDIYKGVTTIKYRNECKSCISEIGKEYAKKNSAIVKQRAKVYRDKNRKSLEAKQRQWRINNKEKYKSRVAKWREDNKEVIKQRRADFYVNNKERLNITTRDHYKNNKEKYRQRQNLYDIKNKDRLLEARRIWERDKLKNDVQYKLQKLLRGRIRIALKNGVKCHGTTELIGCSIQEFRDYMESKFKPGMTWDNHGEWHIDHIIPISWYNLENEYCLKAACNYKNMQPLWAKENYLKNDKRHDFKIDLKIAV